MALTLYIKHSEEAEVKKIKTDKLLRKLVGFWRA